MIVSKPQFDPERCNELAGHIVDLLWPELQHFDGPPVTVPTISRRARERSVAYRSGLSNGEGCVALLIALGQVQTKVLGELCRLEHVVDDEDDLAA